MSANTAASATAKATAEDDSAVSMMGDASQQLASKAKDTYCSASLDAPNIKVLVHLPKKDSVETIVQRLCVSEGYDCSLTRNIGDVIYLLKDVWRQIVVVIDVSTNDLTILLDHIKTNCLKDCVTILGIQPNGHNLSSGLLDRLCEAGISRLVTESDCDKQFLRELHMMKKMEIALKHRLQFSYALLTAVDQCNDAIQITGEDSKIMYVNRAFLDMSGYTREEALGKSAMDILKCSDPRNDNGPRGALTKDQVWDGVCTGRRKSGSVIRHHLKLIPVKMSPEKRVVHHVTIQRLLPYSAPHSYEPDHFKTLSPKQGSSSGSSSEHHTPVLRKVGSLSGVPGTRVLVVETPISKVVQTLSSVRDQFNCPVDIRDSIEKVMEVIRNFDLFSNAPTSMSNIGPKDIVTGLLQTGRRPSLGETTSRSLSAHHLHIRHSAITPPPVDVSELLQNVVTWEFDVIGLERITSMNPLYYTGMEIFKEFRLCEVLDVEDSVIASWLKLMESHYHRSNTYHNSTHAADVLQATAYLIRLVDDQLAIQGDMLEPQEKAAMLITAVIHDLDHPGRTNPFLCNTHDPLAILYNDNAVLENHHAALSFKLTSENKHTNIYQSLDSTTYRELRSTIIDLVLATDMSKHFDILSRFKNILTVDDSGSNSSLAKEPRDTHHLLLQRILVKCADISNACRPQHLCQAWAKKISEEYFSQTAEEKERGLPVVFPDFDELTCNLPQTQIKFIEVFVSGLFEAWHSFCTIPTLMDHLLSNYEYWKSLCPPSTSGSEDEN